MMRGGFLSVLNFLENFCFLVILYVIKYLHHKPSKTAYSLADLADSRRQKTSWGKGSAKADATDSAEKDS